MAINWDDVRYRGDAYDVKELFDTYRVADYLGTVEAERRQQDRGVREKLLKEGIRLTDKISPRIYRVFGDLCAALEIETQPEIFCLSSPEINAFALLDIQESGTYSLVGVTSGALEKLDDIELRSILGHELGHFLFGNNRLNALISTDQNNPSVTVLPPLGESLFLRWRKKAEVSADRVSLIASRDFGASAKSLMKATFGLSEKNLNLDIDSLLSQIDEIKGHPEMIEETFASHPLLPIRLKALDLFSRSQKAKRNRYEGGGDKLLEDEELEMAVDDLITLTRRFPTNPHGRAVMRVISLSGAILLGSDKEIDDDEIKSLIHILQHYFTDEPEKEIVTDRGEIEKRLPEEIEAVNREGDMNAKTFILSRLADLALSDGALMDAEGAVILHTAELLQVPTRTAYSIMVGAAQSSGFRTDVKLNRIAAQLKRSLQAGFASGAAGQPPAV